MNVLTLRSFAFAAIFVVTQSATAGTLYKCVDSKGNSAYQETPCPKASKSADRLGYVTPVKANPSNSWSAQRGALQQQQAQRERLYRAEVPRVSSVAPRGLTPFEQDLAQARADGAASSAWAANKRISRPGRTPQPQAIAIPAPEGQFLTDQHLNRYYQPPGSAFVTEQKTGKQCFVNGAFIHCK